MTVFTVTVYMQNYTLTSKQSNKHILIVVKSHIMKNLMYMYILLLDLMMIKLWQENIHITEKTVIVS
jgi:hypothetical protein